MGNTSFIVSRSATVTSRDVQAEPRTQFAELTGAYWLEPIYAKLANEWDRQGRTVPGEPREHWRVPPDGSQGAEAAGTPSGPGEPSRALTVPGPAPADTTDATHAAGDVHGGRTVHGARELPEPRRFYELSQTRGSGEPGGERGGPAGAGPGTGAGADGTVYAVDGTGEPGTR